MWTRRVGTAEVDIGLSLPAIMPIVKVPLAGRNGPKEANQKRFYSFGLGGGNSRAAQVLEKPLRLCEPSQNGLFSE
jgi:hypothetical protein